MLSLEELRHLRQTNPLSADAATVVSAVQSLISSGKISSTGTDQWDLYEQGMTAALIAADDTLALTCLTRLSDKFPESARVHALKGMHLEATQGPEAAMSFYLKVLEVEPTNVPIIKRRITLLKSTGKVGDAIHALCGYLDVFYTDADAWLELAELYESINAYERANFAYGEAVLINPNDHQAHLQYADSFYTLSVQQPNNATHLETALREYLRAIELSDSLLRGFCGVKICCTALLGGTKTTMSTAELKKLDLLATNALARLTRARALGEYELDFARGLIQTEQIK